MIFFVIFCQYVSLVKLWPHRDRTADIYFIYRLYFLKCKRAFMDCSFNKVYLKFAYS